MRTDSYANGVFRGFMDEDCKLMYARSGNLKEVIPYLSNLFSSNILVVLFGVFFAT